MKRTLAATLEAAFQGSSLQQRKSKRARVQEQEEAEQSENGAGADGAVSEPVLTRWLGDARAWQQVRESEAAVTAQVLAVAEDLETLLWQLREVIASLTPLQLYRRLPSSTKLLRVLADVPAVRLLPVCDALIACFLAVHSSQGNDAAASSSSGSSSAAATAAGATAWVARMLPRLLAVPDTRMDAQDEQWLVGTSGMTQDDFEEVVVVDALRATTKQLVVLAKQHDQGESGVDAYTVAVRDAALAAAAMIVSARDYSVHGVMRREDALPQLVHTLLQAPIRSPDAAELPQELLTAVAGAASQFLPHTETFKQARVWQYAPATLCARLSDGLADVMSQQIDRRRDRVSLLVRQTAASIAVYPELWLVARTHLAQAAMQKPAVLASAVQLCTELAAVVHASSLCQTAYPAAVLPFLRACRRADDTGARDALTALQQRQLPWLMWWSVLLEHEALIWSDVFWLRALYDPCNDDWPDAALDTALACLRALSASESAAAAADNSADLVLSDGVLAATAAAAAAVLAPASSDNVVARAVAAYLKPSDVVIIGDGDDDSDES